LDEIALIGLLSMIGIITLATVVLAYPNWRATYEDMKGSEILNFPAIRVSPQDILPSDNKIEATVEIHSSGPEGEGDQIERIWIDIVNTEEGETYVHGHLNFSDARDIINLIKLEYYNETHYKVTILNTHIEYIRMGDIVGRMIPLGGILSYIDGTAHITIFNPQRIMIEIELSSSIPFKEYSDSLGIYVLDSSDCEILIRKYYKPQQTGRTSIRGLPPLTNKTSFPFVGDSIPYAKIVRIRNDYYVAGRFVGLLVVLADEDVVLRHHNTTIGAFYGGPMSICLAASWDAVSRLGSIDVLVGGEYWGRVAFFEFWFFMNPLFWLSISPLLLILALVLWKRRVRGRAKH